MPTIKERMAALQKAAQQAQPELTSGGSSTVAGGAAAAKSAAKGGGGLGAMVRQLSFSKRNKKPAAEQQAAAAEDQQARGKAAEGVLAAEADRAAAAAAAAPAVGLDLLEMEFPDEPPTPHRGSLKIGQAVSSGGGELGGKVEREGKELASIQKALEASKAEASRLAAEVERLRKQLQTAVAGGASVAPPADDDATALASIDVAVKRAREHADHPAKKPESTAQGAGEAAPAEEWTARGWLDSLDLAAPVAAALLGPLGEERGGASELSFVKALGALPEAQGRAAVGALLRRGDGALGGIVAALWRGMRALSGQRAASGLELNNKFLQEGGAFSLSYGGLSTFFGGLESLIGSPNPSVGEAMRREHCISAPEPKPRTRRLRARARAAHRAGPRAPCHRRRRGGGLAPHLHDGQLQAVEHLAGRVVLRR